MIHETMLSQNLQRGQEGSVRLKFLAEVDRGAVFSAVAPHKA
jgi:hypothetical protein